MITAWERERPARLCFLSQSVLNVRSERDARAPGDYGTIRVGPLPLIGNLSS